MTFDILTAASANGIITAARGARSTDLIPALAVPPQVLAYHRELRRGYDGVFVGPATVRINDPTLTSHAEPGVRPVRITLDPAGTIPAQARFFDGSARTIVAIGRRTPRAYVEMLRRREVEVAVCGGERIALADFARALAERGVRRVVVEGGGRLNRELLASGMVDRIHLILLPVMLDSAAVNLFEGAAGAGGRLHLESWRQVADFLLLEYSVRQDP
jgi:2,5-diamino-6-(ribosylamino)-4(3H)-pyrimidinone 5'-phosphate reductase